MTHIADVISWLEMWADPSLQESYDNSGLIVGKPHSLVTNILVSLDCTEEIVHEAIGRKCNLIIAHHPIVFSGLKKLNGANYVQRTVELAIKNDIAIYAIHTNLDNIISGVNAKMASKLGLKNCKILQAKRGMLKQLNTYCPPDYTNEILEGLFEAGAGEIGNYSECSFLTEGLGTYKGNEDSNPFIGTVGERSNEPETRLSIIFPVYREKQILAALRAIHPYEQIAYEILSLDNEWQQAGSGLVGELEHPMPTMDFMKLVKEKFHVKSLKHTKIHKKSVQRIALCGGAGSFLLSKAKSTKADVYISSDFKYHEFFDAENQIIIADIGHYESEQFTIDLLVEKIAERFSTFAVHLTNLVTNPVNYL